MGPRKIEIDMVKDARARQVTFSKRRTGLFKETNEFATLCAARVTIIVFSPGGKSFSFGQPNLQSVVSQFLNCHRQHKADSSSELAIVAVNENIGSEAKRGRTSKMMRRLRAEDKKWAALNRKLRSKELVESTYKLSVDGLGTIELKEYRNSLEGLCGNLRTRINELKVSVPRGRSC